MLAPKARGGTELGAAVDGMDDLEGSSRSAEGKPGTGTSWTSWASGEMIVDARRAAKAERKLAKLALLLDPVAAEQEFARRAAAKAAKTERKKAKKANDKAEKAAKARLKAQQLAARATEKADRAELKAQRQAARALAREAAAEEELAGLARASAPDAVTHGDRGASAAGALLADLAELVRQVSEPAAPRDAGVAAAPEAEAEPEAAAEPELVDAPEPEAAAVPQLEPADAPEPEPEPAPEPAAVDDLFEAEAAAVPQLEAEAAAEPARVEGFDDDAPLAAFRPWQGETAQDVDAEATAAEAAATEAALRSAGPDDGVHADPYAAHWSAASMVPDVQPAALGDAQTPEAGDSAMVAVGATPDDELVLDDDALDEAPAAEPVADVPDAATAPEPETASETAPDAATAAEPEPAGAEPEAAPPAFVVPDAAVGLPVGAAIDIGANSVHLLVAAINDHDLVPLIDESVFLGLGAQVAAEGFIGDELRARLVDALAGYVEKARALGAQAITIVGTEPVRRAQDSASLAYEVQARTGVGLYIVDHEEEGLLMFLGVTGGRAPDGDMLVVDVGGGSTELVDVDRSGSARAVGLALGSARLTRALLTGDPPLRSDLEGVRAVAARILRDAPNVKPVEIVGVGGTVSNLLKLVPGDAGEPVLSRRGIAIALTLILEQPAAESAARFGVRPERARLLPAGGVITDEILRRYGADSMRVSEEGIREGAVLAAAAAGPAWRDRLRRLARGNDS